MNNSEKLQSLMARSMLLDPAALKEFYSLILVTTVFVPERTQALPLSNEAVYPSPLFNLLGVRDGEYTFIPVFTDSTFIKTWSGQEFIFREMDFKRVLELCPENWEILLDPSQETEKLFTYWEIQKLSQGDESIDEIISEILSDNSEESLNTQTVIETEYLTLKEKLSAHAKNSSFITKLYLLEETTNDDTLLSQLLLGVEVSTDDKSIFFLEEQNIKQVADLEMVGSYTVKVRAFSSEDQIFKNLFMATKPFYIKS